jgi:hypothetical protein
MGLRSASGAVVAALALVTGGWYVGGGASTPAGAEETGGRAAAVERVVRGGYYLGGNADIRPNTTARGMPLGSLTTYRSLHDSHVFPGWRKEWIAGLMRQGVEPNFVVELKTYGGPPPDEITCGGRTYETPDANMTAQQRPRESWPRFYGYDQVTSGKLDGLLCRAVQQLDKLPAGPVTVQFASERDTDHEFGITLNGVARTFAQADALAIPAYTYLITYFKRHSTRAGTTYTAGMGGWHHDSFVRSYVPAADQIQYNAYNHRTPRSAYDTFHRAYAWLAELPAASQGKPVVIAEWGTSYNLGDQAAWIATVPAAIARLPRVRMTNYFDSDGDWGTLQPRAAGLDALKAAYRSRPYVAAGP